MQAVLAFAGTELSIKDMTANAVQAVGMTSGQYRFANQLALRAQEHTPKNYTLQFTGHSLGGGLATTAALVTGLNATIFNAAGIHPNSLMGVGHPASIDNAPRLITAFSTTGDPLTNLQRIEDRKVFLPKVIPGNTVPPIALKASMLTLNQHGIKAVIKALESKLR